MARERIKPIKLTDTESGKEYILEFNRATIKLTEQSGFDITEANKKPITSLSKLWYYSFKMHHPEVTAEKAEKLFDEIGEIPEGLIERLFALYNAGAESLSVENPKVAVTL